MENRSIAPNTRVLHEFEVALANIDDEFTFSDLQAELNASNINNNEGLWVQTQQPESEALPYCTTTHTNEDLGSVRGEFLTGFSQFTVPRSNIERFKLRAKVAGVLFRVKVYG